MKNISRYAVVTCLTIIAGSGFTTSSVHADNLPDVTRMLGNIHIDDNEKVGDIRSVNGDVALDSNVIAGAVKSTNGEIRFKQDVMIREAHTVNGSIRSDRNLLVEANLTTINGRIKLRSGASIGEDVRTVNGDIQLADAIVGRDVETTNGSIRLMGTLVKGDVVFKDTFSNKYDNRRDRPTLVVDADSEIQGRIFLERDVILKIDDAAKIGHIIRGYE